MTTDPNPKTPRPDLAPAKDAPRDQQDQKAAAALAEKTALEVALKQLPTEQQLRKHRVGADRAADEAWSKIRDAHFKSELDAAYREAGKSDRPDYGKAQQEASKKHMEWEKTAYKEFMTPANQEEARLNYLKNQPEIATRAKEFLGSPEGQKALEAAKAQIAREKEMHRQEARKFVESGYLDREIAKLSDADKAIVNTPEGREKMAEALTEHLSKPDGIAYIKLERVRDNVREQTAEMSPNEKQKFYQNMVDTGRVREIPDEERLGFQSYTKSDTRKAFESAFDSVKSTVKFAAGQTSEESRQIDKAEKQERARVNSIKSIEQVTPEDFRKAQLAYDTRSFGDAMRREGRTFVTSAEEFNKLPGDKKPQALADIKSLVHQQNGSKTAAVRERNSQEAQAGAKGVTTAMEVGATVGAAVVTGGTSLAAQAASSIAMGQAINEDSLARKALDGRANEITWKDGVGVAVDGVAGIVPGGAAAKGAKKAVTAGAETLVQKTMAAAGSKAKDLAKDAVKEELVDKVSGGLARATGRDTIGAGGEGKEDNRLAQETSVDERVAENAADPVVPTASAVDEPVAAQNADPVVPSDNTVTQVAQETQAPESQNPSFFSNLAEKAQATLGELTGQADGGRTAQLDAQLAQIQAAAGPDLSKAPETLAADAMASFKAFLSEKTSPVAPSIQQQAAVAQETFNPDKSFGELAAKASEAFLKTGQGAFTAEPAFLKADTAKLAFNNLGEKAERVAAMAFDAVKPKSAINERIDDLASLTADVPQALKAAPGFAEQAQQMFAAISNALPPEIMAMAKQAVQGVAKMDVAQAGVEAMSQKANVNVAVAKSNDGLHI